MGHRADKSEKHSNGRETSAAPPTRAQSRTQDQNRRKDRRPQAKAAPSPQAVAAQQHAEVGEKACAGLDVKLSVHLDHARRVRPVDMHANRRASRIAREDAGQGRHLLRRAHTLGHLQLDRRIRKKIPRGQRHLLGRKLDRSVAILHPHLDDGHGVRRKHRRNRLIRGGEACRSSSTPLAART